MRIKRRQYLNVVIHTGSSGSTPNSKQSSSNSSKAGMEIQTCLIPYDHHNFVEECIFFLNSETDHQQ